MSDTKESLPLDTRLLSDAIIELNISRHNVAIYPKNHPIVEKSLNLAFDFLQKLFELRRKITLAVARDTIIIDDYSLDKNNPVYREFALSLSSLHIAYVTFRIGLTKEELYAFHSFILNNPQEVLPEEIESLFEAYKMSHIQARFIDYSAFNLVEGKIKEKEQNVLLWEKYLFGLLEGTLETGEASGFIHEIPPGKLASLINIAGKNKLPEDSYDKVITSYVRTSSERAFSAQEMRKLTDFINELRPELKRQFLTSAVNTVSEDLDSLKKSLGDMSVDEVIDLINTINEQMVAMPTAMKNVLDKFSDLHQGGFEAPSFDGNLVEDDILLSPDVVSLLNEANFNAFVSDSYQEEIQSLMKFDAGEIDSDKKKELERELENASIENVFHQIVLEIISSDNYDVIQEEEYEFFINCLKEETEQFIGTGQYLPILEMFKVLESNSRKNRFKDLNSATLKHFRTSQFVSSLIHSLRLFGREKREEAIALCEFYGEQIIPILMDALTDEESQTVRRFIINILIRFGDKAAVEAAKRLNVEQWFVQRNMLFIMKECGNSETIQKARTYCNSRNHKVSFEAIQCLLKINDAYAVKSLKKHLRSESRDVVMKAVALAGAFRVKDAVPDLISVLKKKTISGIDFQDKILVVKALGRIGDCRALDPLKNVLSSKTIILKESLKRLKDEIYASLNNYEHAAAKELLDQHKRQDTARTENGSLKKSKGK